MHESEGVGAVLVADLNGVNASVCIEVEEVGGNVCEEESFGNGEDGGAEGHSADAAYEGS